MTQKERNALIYSFYTYAVRWIARNDIAYDTSLSECISAKNFRYEFVSKLPSVHLVADTFNKGIKTVAIAVIRYRKENRDEL